MFKVYKTDDGRNAPIEYLPCSAITPKLGMALTMSGGKLVTASGTTMPTYICMREEAAVVTAGTIIPVIRVSKDIIFETVSTASFASVALGSKVTVDSTGMKVTATTGDTGAEVVGIEDTAAGGKIHVRF